MRARGAAKYGKHVWPTACRHPRDVAMRSRAARPTLDDRSCSRDLRVPGDLQHDANGAPDMESFGMASARACAIRTSEESAYDRARKALVEEASPPPAGVPRQAPPGSR
ncbi:hypothetical protein GCM10023238_27100 [Streptomyces heliomycini]